MRKAAVVSLALVVALGFGVTSLRAGQELDGLKVGAAAPDFTLKDLDGEEVSLSDLKGKVVYLDFWATWCPPCRAALPHTQELSASDDAKEGELVVLAVDQREDIPTIRRFMLDQDYSFRVLLDSDGAVGDQYGVTGIPQFVVIDHEGKVAWHAVGFSGEELPEGQHPTAATPGRIDAAVEAALEAAEQDEDEDDADQRG